MIQNQYGKKSAAQALFYFSPKFNATYVPDNVTHRTGFISAFSAHVPDSVTERTGCTGQSA